jgi:hypothetical protein
MEKYKREEIKHYIFLTHKKFSLYARNECFKNSAIPAVHPLGSLVYANSCKENLTCIEYTVLIVGLLYILRPPSCIIGNNYTKPPTGLIFVTFNIGDFTKVCRETPDVVKIVQKCQVLYITT